MESTKTLTCLAKNANVRVAAKRRPERVYFPWVTLEQIITFSFAYAKRSY